MGWCISLTVFYHTTATFNVLAVGRGRGTAERMSTDYTLSFSLTSDARVAEFASRKKLKRKRHPGTRAWAMAWARAAAICRYISAERSADAAFACACPRKGGGVSSPFTVRAQYMHMYNYSCECVPQRSPAASPPVRSRASGSQIFQRNLSVMPCGFCQTK